MSANFFVSLQQFGKFGANSTTYDHAIFLYFVLPLNATVLMFKINNVGYIV